MSYSLSHPHVAFLVVSRSSASDHVRHIAHLTLKCVKKRVSKVTRIYISHLTGIRYTMSLVFSYTFFLSLSFLVCRKLFVIFFQRANVRTRNVLSLGGKNSFRPLSVVFFKVFRIKLLCLLIPLLLLLLFLRKFV